MWRKGFEPSGTAMSVSSQEQNFHKAVPVVVHQSNQPSTQVRIISTPFQLSRIMEAGTTLFPLAFWKFKYRVRRCATRTLGSSAGTDPAWDGTQDQGKKMATTSYLTKVQLRLHFRFAASIAWTRNLSSISRRSAISLDETRVLLLR